MVKAVINSKNGLHARPASEIVAKATQYAGDVTLIKEGNRFNAKSIMSVMGLGLMYGDSVEIEVSGDNATEMEETLKALIEGITE